MKTKFEILDWTIGYLKDELSAIGSDLSGLQRDLEVTSTDGGAFSRIRKDIRYVSSELSRLKGDIAKALAAPTDRDADDEVQVEHHGQFGKVTMIIHYTLGNGVARVLCDEVEAAVFDAYRHGRREVCTSRPGIPVKLEMNYRRVGLLYDLRYDREENLCFIHLELCRTQRDIDDENCFF